MRLPAPAKLNLFLHITGQRQSGYHDLETYFLLIDACDWLSFTPNLSGQIQIELTNQTGSAPVLDSGFYENNLIARAGELLKSLAIECGADKSKIQKLGAHCLLEKSLPLGGGLGGGSSNAATALLGLNQLWSLELPADLLVERSLSLGADVPVFVAGASAWATGLGEVLQPVKPITLVPALKFLVVLTPEAHISTQTLFNHPKLNKSSESMSPDQYQANPEYFNNCFEPLLNDQPHVQAALTHLRRFDHQALITARLTGTGACVFAGFSEATTAKQALESSATAGFIAQPTQYSALQTTLTQAT
jgi:4-diphosphocytidyl-2-C-methyl-D-erythritol kinase